MNQNPFEEIVNIYNNAVEEADKLGYMDGLEFDAHLHK